MGHTGATAEPSLPALPSAPPCWLHPGEQWGSSWGLGGNSRNLGARSAGLGVCTHTESLVLCRTGQVIGRTGQQGMVNPKSGDTELTWHPLLSMAQEGSGGCELWDTTPSHLLTPWTHRKQHSPGMQTPLVSSSKQSRVLMQLFLSERPSRSPLPGSAVPCTLTAFWYILLPTPPPAQLVRLGPRGAARSAHVCHFRGISLEVETGRKETVRQQGAIGAEDGGLQKKFPQAAGFMQSGCVSRNRTRVLQRQQSRHPPGRVGLQVGEMLP